ncbi:uncharacterized protein LOC114364739 isoform X2 [Ostrinia furnacalis]|uniref:uncharacterized protein LOC114364739 isoform X2 n=2 Tax=Ostrinia furnacalis TaxID=93504 RepID=UPI001038AF43|nr:uncharacterized protein LOC114364739 isoform X2 [Ostrinia furnacalis]
MESQELSAGTSPAEKSKMALAGNFDGMLLPLYPEPDDSGIDSDNAESQQQAASVQRFEERFIANLDLAALPRDGKGWCQRYKEQRNNTGHGLAKGIEDGHLDPFDVDWPIGLRMPPTVRQPTFAEPRRSASPPILEVELTASEEDEEDDVLELVIPMHQPRYQRVPTDSPTRAKPTTKAKIYRFFLSLLCCFRK